MLSRQAFDHRYFGILFCFVTKRCTWVGDGYDIVSGSGLKGSKQSLRCSVLLFVYGQSVLESMSVREEYRKVQGTLSFILQIPSFFSVQIVGNGNYTCIWKRTNSHLGLRLDVDCGNRGLVGGSVL